jgi:hypothetical protein
MLYRQGSWHEVHDELLAHNRSGVGFPRLPISSLQHRGKLTSP